MGNIGQAAARPQGNTIMKKTSLISGVVKLPILLQIAGFMCLFVAGSTEDERSPKVFNESLNSENETSTGSRSLFIPILESERSAKLVEESAKENISRQDLSNETEIVELETDGADYEDITDLRHNPGPHNHGSYNHGYHYTHPPILYYPRNYTYKNFTYSKPWFQKYKHFIHKPGFIYKYNHTHLIWIPLYGHHGHGHHGFTGSYGHGHHGHAGSYGYGGYGFGKFGKHGYGGYGHHGYGYHGFFGKNKLYKGGYGNHGYYGPYGEGHTLYPISGGGFIIHPHRKHGDYGHQTRRKREAENMNIALNYTPSADTDGGYVEYEDDGEGYGSSGSGHHGHYDKYLDYDFKHYVYPPLYKGKIPSLLKAVAWGYYDYTQKFFRAVHNLTRLAKTRKNYQAYKEIHNFYTTTTRATTTTTRATTKATTKPPGTNTSTTTSPRTTITTEKTTMVPTMTSMVPSTTFAPNITTTTPKSRPTYRPKGSPSYSNPRESGYRATLGTRKPNNPGTAFNYSPNDQTYYPAVAPHETYPLYPPTEEIVQPFPNLSSSGSGPNSGLGNFAVSSDGSGGDSDMNSLGNVGMQDLQSTQEPPQIIPNNGENIGEHQQEQIEAAKDTVLEDVMNEIGQIQNNSQKASLAKKKIVYPHRNYDRTVGIRRPNSSPYSRIPRNPWSYGRNSLHSPSLQSSYLRRFPGKPQFPRNYNVTKTSA